uniref:Uncharacterized protein n=1 Tax=Tetranychus urticae TaxID=32264 RepID=T1KLS0_TETUR
MLINDNHSVQAQARRRCLDIPCSNLRIEPAEDVCRERFRERFGEPRTLTIFQIFPCDGGLNGYQCCALI